MAPRRSGWVLLLVLLLVLLSVPAGAGAGVGPPWVVVSGRVLDLDVAPIRESDRLLVPMRAIFEALGATIEWDGATRSISAWRAGVTMQLTIDRPTARVGDRSVNLDPPPRLLSGRTMVPLRFVAESLGALVGWDAATQTASISSGQGSGEGEGGTGGSAAAADAPLAMDLPAGWRQVVTDDGAVLAGPDPERSAPVVVVWPLVGQGDRLLPEALDRLSSRLGNLQYGVLRSVQGRSHQIVTATGARGRGVLAFATEGDRSLLSGVLLPAGSTAADLDNSLAALASMRWQGGVKPAGLPLVRVDDPTESAFTVLVPEGWQTDIGTDRIYIDANFFVDASSGDQGYFFTSRLPPGYSDVQGLFPEGSPYPLGSATLEVRSVRDAAAYVRTLMPTIMAGVFDGITLQSVVARPDLAAQVPRNALVQDVTAAEARWVDSAQRSHHSWVFVGVYGLPGTWPLWTAGVRHAWGQPADLPTAEAAMNAAMTSFTVDPAWAAAESQQVLVRSRILSRSQESIANSLRQSFDLKWQSQDRTFKGWSQAMLGTKEVYDPLLSEKWTVPNDASQYWTNASQTVIGTRTGASPAPDFRELMELKP